MGVCAGAGEDVRLVPAGIRLGTTTGSRMGMTFARGVERVNVQVAGDPLDRVLT